MNQWKLNDYCYPKIVPWNRVLCDLMDSGLTASAICELIDVQWSSLQRWRDGTDPKHSIGNAILRLHKRHCGAELNARRLAQAE